MRHGIKLGKRGDGLTQVMKLLGQVFKNSRIRNIVLLFHHNLSNYPFGFPLRQYHSLQLGGRWGPTLVPDRGPDGLKACSCILCCSRGGADRCPAIGQPGPETSGCQGPRVDPRVGASLGFFSLWSPERPPHGRSRGSARKINLAGELRPLSCYAFAKRWLLPQYCIMNFQPCLDHIILNYRY